MKKIILILLLVANIILAQGNREKNSAMENYRVYQMTKILELTPKQSQSFFPMLRSHIMRIHNIDEKISDLDRQVDSKKTINKNDYKKIKNKLLKLESEKLNEKYKFINNLENVLNPEQIVRYLFFDRKFRRGLRQHLKHKNTGNLINPDRYKIPYERNGELTLGWCGGRHEQ